MKEAFILTSFKLQPRTGTSVFSLYNPRDNSKYFEFTVMGKLNRGRTQIKEAGAPFKFHLAVFILSKLLLISVDFRGTYGENRLRLGNSFRFLHRCHSSSQVGLIMRGSENHLYN